jgi:P27 family predicted phage terminase small subunit
VTRKRPSLALVREGNPGHRPQSDLEGGVRLEATAPEEPRWQDWFPPVRVPTVKQLEKRWPLAVVEGSLTHIEHSGKRAALAKAKRAWLIQNERETAEQMKGDNQRCRDVAREEWRRIVGVLDAQGLLALVDHEVLADYCRVVARIDQCERDISRNGVWVRGERGAQKNPSTTVVNQLRGQLKFYLGELGLTPVARDRLNPREADDDGDSPFD